MEVNLGKMLIGPFVIIVVSTMIFFAARKAPKKSQHGETIFGYPNFVSKFFWICYFIFVGLFAFGIFYNLTKFGEYPPTWLFVFLGILFLIFVFLSRAAKVEYLKVSADGETLTKAGVFSGRVVFSWKDIVEMRESEDGQKVPVFILNNGKKVKFQSMWSGRAEFFRLLSQKRPDLSIKSAGRTYSYPPLAYKILCGVVIGYYVFLAFLVIYDFSDFIENTLKVLTSVAFVASLGLPMVLFIGLTKFEYLKVSADGNTLTKSSPFGGKVNFTWSDVIKIELDKGNKEMPVLILNNGKKIKFRSAWLGVDEFFALISQKRPDLLKKFELK